jgi:NitT/TauT family transport system ATP-binding protein
MQDELIRIRAETGKTILFVTHDIEEATYLADRIVVLSGAPGRIVATHRIDAAHPRRRTDRGLQSTAVAIRADLEAEVADGAGI